MWADTFADKTVSDQAYYLDERILETANGCVRQTKICVRPNTNLLPVTVRAVLKSRDLGFKRFLWSSSERTQVSLSSPEIRLSFSEFDIWAVLNSFHPKVSSATFPVTNKLLKTAGLALTTPLKLLFKSCITQQCSPTTWKKTYVTPIPKQSKDQTIPVNWRPISCLNQIFKISRGVRQKRSHYFYKSEMFWKTTSLRTAKDAQSTTDRSVDTKARGCTGVWVQSGRHIPRLYQSVQSCQSQYIRKTTKISGTSRHGNQINQ